MKTIRFISLALCYLLQQEALAFDFPRPERQHAFQCKTHCVELEKMPLSYQWTLPDHAIYHRRPLLRKSKSYEKKVSFQQLCQGVAIDTEAAEAIIRISLPPKTEAPQLYLQTTKKQSYTLQTASAEFSNQEQLYPGVNDQPTLLQLKKAIGSGHFILKSQQYCNQAGMLRIHVYDKFANLYLSIKTDKQAYYFKDEIQADIEVSHNFPYDVDDIHARLVSPSGEEYPMNIKQITEYQYQAVADLNMENHVRGGNWYVSAEISAVLDDSIFTRTGWTAFDYITPNARLVRLIKGQEANQYLVEVEAENSSRFALNAVLYHQDEYRDMRPLAMIQSADWLEAGKGKLTLRLDNDLLKHYDSKRLYLGYFHLVDYNQLKTVYHYDEPIQLSHLE